MNVIQDLVKKADNIKGEDRFDVHELLKHLHSVISELNREDPDARQMEYDLEAAKDWIDNIEERY